MPNSRKENQHPKGQNHNQRAAPGACNTERTLTSHLRRQATWLIFTLNAPSFGRNSAALVFTFSRTAQTPGRYAHVYNSHQPH